MTTAEDYALTEMWFWRLVSIATAILDADQEKAEALRAQEQQAIEAIDRALAEQPPIQTAATHRYRIDVDRLAATG